MHTENSARCHAHNRKGNPCRRWAVPGKRVCHYHGGAPGSGAPKGNMNRYVHGLYSRSARVPQRIKERAKELMGVQGLREQIATQRALIEAAVEEGRDLIAISRATEALTRMVRAEHAMNEKSDEGLTAAITDVLERVGGQMGLQEFIA